MEILNHPENACTCCNAKNSYRFLLSAPDLHYGNDGSWNIYKCDNCQHVLQIPIPSQEDLLKYYPSAYYAYNEKKNILQFSPRVNPKFWLRAVYLKTHKNYGHLPVPKSYLLSLVYKVLFRKPLDLDTPTYVTNGSMLDYGAGTGTTVSIYEQYGWTSTGIEISGDACKVGKANGLNIIQGDETALAQFKNQFDLIYTSHTVEHVINPQGLFKYFYDALKPGGTLLITTPNADAHSINKFGALAYYLTLPVHINIFSCPSMKQLLEKTGFKEIEFNTISSWRTLAMTNNLKRHHKKNNPIQFNSEANQASLSDYLATIFVRLASLQKSHGDCLVFSCKKPL